MRRFLPLLFAVLPLTAQSNDSKTLESLLTEVRELRLAIERSTLLGARTQLAVSHLQLDEAAATRAAQQLADLRSEGPASTGHVAELTERAKHLEDSRTSPEWTAPQKHDELETLIKQTKLELDQAAAYEQQRAVRESDLASQLQRAQAQVADTRARIAQMEQALDAAIQQLLKPH
jgi:hypothetical protein